MNDTIEARHDTAPDVERAVLGAMLVDNQTSEDAQVTLTEEAFSDKMHKMIFRAIGVIKKSTGMVDQLTVMDALRSLGKCDEFAYEDLVAAIISEVYSVTNYDAHRNILLEKMKLRRLENLEYEIRSMIQGNHPAAEILTTVFDRMNGMQNLDGESHVYALADVLPLAFQQIVDRFEKPGGMVGIPTGIGRLDTITGGWQEGNYIIIAAPTGKGKTTLAMMQAIHAARNGHPVAMFSLEMSAVEIAERIVGADAQVHIRPTSEHAGLSQSEWTRVNDTCTKMMSLPFVLDMTPGLNINKLRTRAILLQRRYGIELLLVDYLQLMPGAGEKSRQLEVAAISQGLKRLARELGIAVMAISQFSRPIKGQEDAEPHLSWLRDSGSLEQDADIVLFIHNPDNQEKEALLKEYRPQMPPTNLDSLRLLKVAKHRQGPTGDILLNFDAEHFRFTDL